MNQRPTHPARRNYITQKVRIAGQQTLPPPNLICEQILAQKARQFSINEGH